MAFSEIDRLTPGTELARDAPMFDIVRRFAFASADAPLLTVETARLGAARLCRVVSTGHEISLIEPQHATVLIPRAGRLEIETTRRRLLGGPGDMIVLTPNARVTAVLPDASGAYRCDVALVPTDAAGRERSLDPPREGAIRAPALEACLPAACGGAGSGLRRYLDFLFHELARADAAAASARAREASAVLLTELLQGLVDDAGEPGPRLLPSGADARLVAAAETIMEARHAEPLAIAAVAGELGVTLRRLQYAFGRVRGTTPRAALNRIRLERARARLARPQEGSTVTQVALDCGFAHVGRFSRAYARAFGEPPSATLRRGTQGRRPARG